MELAAGDWPLLGLPSARHVVVFLFDYTCAECRHMRRVLEPVMARFRGQLAVLAVPVPLDPACNPAAPPRAANRPDACAYARLGWALWAADPLAYARWEQWVFDGGGCAPPLIEALARARELAPGAGLRAEGSDPDAAERLAAGVAVYQSIDLKHVPALLLPNAAVHGRLASAAELCGILEREFGLNAGPSRAAAAGAMRPIAAAGRGF